MNMFPTSITILIAAAGLLPCISAMPVSTNSAPSTHAIAFTTGVNIINQYTNPQAPILHRAFRFTLPVDQLSLIANTCEILTSHEVMRSISNHTEELSDLLQFIRGSLSHGCIHVRDLVGELNATESESGSGSEETVDSCSNLHYLHNVCNGPEVKLYMEWQSLHHASKHILDTIGIDEGVKHCEWLRDNVMVTPLIRSLFNTCSF